MSVRIIICLLFLAAVFLTDLQPFKFSQKLHHQYIVNNLIRIKRSLDEPNESTFRSEIRLVAINKTNLLAFDEILKPDGLMTKCGFIGNVLSPGIMIYVKCFPTFEDILHTMKTSKTNSSLTDMDIIKASFNTTNNTVCANLITHYILGNEDSTNLIKWLETSLRNKVDLYSEDLHGCKARMLFESSCCTQNNGTVRQINYREIQLKVG